MLRAGLVALRRFGVSQWFAMFRFRGDLPAVSHCRAMSRLLSLVHCPGHTQQEIADAVGVAPMTVNDRIKSYTDLDKCPKPYKIAAPTRARRHSKSCQNSDTIIEAFPHPYARGGTFAEFCKSPLWYPTPARARYIVVCQKSDKHDSPLTLTRAVY